MTNVQPIVTIITPYRNAEAFIPDYIDSIKSQTFSNWITILIDDHSIDNGPALLSQLVSGDPRFKLIRNSHQREIAGPASARNCGLDLVTTQLTAFCDIDDLWHPLKLELQLAFHLHGQYDITVTGYTRFTNDIPSINENDFICPPFSISYSQLFRRNPIPMLTVILSSTLAKRGFEQIKHEDFLFWLTLFRHYDSINYGCLPLNLSFYRLHNLNQTRHHAKLPFWTYYVFKRHGCTTRESLFFLLHWLCDHTLYKLKNLISSTQSHYTLLQLLEMSPLHLKPTE